jgi:hypothetical protein
MEGRGISFLEVQGSVAAVARVVRGVIGEVRGDSISGYPRLGLFLGWSGERGLDEWGKVKRRRNRERV